MPTLRSGTVTTVTGPVRSDPTECPPLHELIPTVDRESAAEPAGDGLHWEIAVVRFQAPEFGGDHFQHVNFTWWLRFRVPDEATVASMEARAKEIVRAMYSPPMEYQRSCDFCTRTDATGHRYYYEIPDRSFLMVAIMPPDMHTSDDDYDAAIGPKMTIAACKRMKAARDARRAQTQK